MQRQGRRDSGDWHAQERLFDQSDAYRVHVCERCGLFAVANLKKNQFHCPACKNTTGIVQASLSPLPHCHICRSPAACLATLARTLLVTFLLFG